MGFFKDLIEKLIKRNNTNLLEEGSNKTDNQNSSRDNFREQYVKNISTMSPEQLKAEFFHEMGLANFTSNPICRDFLFSMPYINEITDETSYNTAKECIELLDGGETSNLGKNLIFNDHKNKYIVNFSQTNSEYKVDVTKCYIFDNREGKDIESRTYDSNTGLELKRLVKSNVNGRASNEYTISRDGTAGESIGIARIDDEYSPNFPSFFDLTNLTVDISELDFPGVITSKEYSIFSRLCKNGQTAIRSPFDDAYLNHTQKEELKNDEEFKSRLSEKISQSKVKNSAIESEKSIN